jgi:hypothetical protein
MCFSCVENRVRGPRMKLDKNINTFFSKKRSCYPHNDLSEFQALNYFSSETPSSLKQDCQTVYFQTKKSQFG